jgi:hypothetical protein
MSLAISAGAHRFNAEMLADLPVLQAPKFPPPPPPEPLAEFAIGAKSMAQLDGDWCGTKPRPIPPTPPQPWLDLGAAAQSFR